MRIYAYGDREEDRQIRYALFSVLQIPNYTKIEAISRDGRRLFISRRDCAVDCKDVRVQYYEVTLP